MDRDNFQGDPDLILFDITNSGRVEHFVGGLTTTHTAPGLGITTRLTLGLDYSTAFNQQNFPFDHVLQPRGLRNLNEWEHRTLTFDLGTTWDHDISETLSSSFSAGGQLFRRLGSHDVRHVGRLRRPGREDTDFRRDDDLQRRSPQGGERRVLRAGDHRHQ